ncbi:hypothetical protein MHY_18310 [Megamonas hypermegale ART12/1]|nr:hypothetical protein MHY_18310 [Megamonas hypermegale ART12/1]
MLPLAKSLSQTALTASG